MRTICLIAWIALESACASYRVRCDSHLRPINPPRTAAIGSRTHTAAVDASAQGDRARARGGESPGNP